MEINRINHINQMEKNDKEHNDRMQQQQNKFNKDMYLMAQNHQFNMNYYQNIHQNPMYPVIYDIPYQNYQNVY